MILVLKFIIALIKTLCKNKVELALILMAQEQQLQSYKRQKKRPIITDRDRAFWISFKDINHKWMNVLIFVKPETVIQWQRKHFKRYWLRKCLASKRGRPAVRNVIRSIIYELSKRHPLWGNKRIRDELAHINVYASKNTVEKYRFKLKKPPSQSWRTFLKNHVKELIAIDLFVVPTIGNDICFGLVIISHDRRQILWTNATYTPNGQWIGQQLVNTFPLMTPLATFFEIGTITTTLILDEKSML